MSQSAPLSTLTPEIRKSIRGICFDIDDTFSTHGKITADAFDSLWELKRAGFYLVPVTGRPAGWCDHLARFWPVDGVVGENGAFTFYMHDKIRKRMDTLSDADSTAAKSKLHLLAAAIKNKFPDAEFASDQNYREYDLAIDFCEDVKPWPLEKVDKLVQFCESQGAIAKISSIHVNTWFGRYTKRDGIKKFVDYARANLDPKFPAFGTQGDEWIYVGDSPNDEPLFEIFSKSVGVANVAQFLPKMKYHPTWITNKPCGQGFAELAHLLLG